MLRSLLGRGLPLLAILLLGAGCGQEKASGTGLTGQLELAGSSTVAPLASEIGKRFESAHPGVQINVQAGGSSRGIADARRALVDIGTASRALKASESQGLISHTIALDGIAVILHADNPVAALTGQQIKGIYTGTIDNWSAVAGGIDAPITVVNKAAGRATLELFLEHFDLDNKNIHADAVVGHNEQGIKTVAGNKNAIGYVSIGTAEYDAEHGTPIKLLPLNGVAASIDNVRSSDYPLARPLNLVTQGQPSGLAKAFINYAQSPTVHDIVKRLYYVPAQ